ncbi:MAG TPA: hypothetical protein VJX73_05205 [Terracidiphilus sp.]|nr:hypothetical protein [Terracidiphilus sp.]
MRTRILSILVYTGAGLTLAVAICVPFVLMGAFSNAFAHAGLHIDAAYSGGTITRTIQRNGYRIGVYPPVQPRLLERIEPFVQIVFEPADALPPRVSDEIDLDGDGQPDVRVSFNLPADPDAPLRGDVTALNASYISLTNVAGESFSRMVVRTGNKIVVRVPLNKDLARR